MTRDTLAATAASAGTLAARYNYHRFRIRDYDWDPMPGPRPGERLDDFSVRRLDGGELCLSDLRGRPVVLEMGSYTCPQFVANVERMQALRRRYPHAVFLVLYTREAHPGERVGPHAEYFDKQMLAHRLRQEHGDGRTYLVDDLDGRVNRMLGAWPNATYVLDGRGTVIYRSMFTWPPTVAEILDELFSGRPMKPREGYGFVLAVRHLLPVFLRGGWRAVRDFAVQLPQVVSFHLRMTRVRRRWRAELEGTVPVSVAEPAAE